MPPLRAAARENAVGRLQAGQRQADVAHALNVSQSTISIGSGIVSGNLAPQLMPRGQADHG